MNNYFINERLGQYRMAEAIDAARHDRLVREAETEPSEATGDRVRTVQGRVTLDAAGARQVPGL